VYIDINQSVLYAEAECRLLDLPIGLPVFCDSVGLLQILRHGFFHADPHPGNVSVDPGSGRSPALLFYDFGMMGLIVPNVRERLLDVFYGIYRYAAAVPHGVFVNLRHARRKGHVTARASLPQARHTPCANIRQVCITASLYDFCNTCC